MAFLILCNLLSISFIEKSAVYMERALKGARLHHKFILIFVHYQIPEHPFSNEYVRCVIQPNKSLQHVSIHSY